MQCRTVTNQFTARKLPLKLRAARGYFIIEYDKGGVYETKSIMVNSLKQLSLQQWIDEAEAFAKELGIQQED